MSDPVSREKAIELVEQVWGSRSPDLGKWVGRERRDLELGFEYDPDATDMDKQERFVSAVEAATRLVLNNWERTEAPERETAVRTLSVAAARLDDDQFLIGD